MSALWVWSFYIWSDEKSDFVATDKYSLINEEYGVYTDQEKLDPEIEKHYATPEILESILNKELAIPLMGKFSQIYFDFNLYTFNSGTAHIKKYFETKLEVISQKEIENELTLYNDGDVIEDQVIVVAGEDDYIINAVLSTRDASQTYTFSATTSKSGVVDVIKGDNGKFTVRPTHAGLVDLKVTVKITETVKIEKIVDFRVLDAIFDVAKIDVPDGVHLVGQDLTVSLNIRGFTNIKNVKVQWAVVDKKGNALTEEHLSINHKNASLTLKDLTNGDYTITVSYQDIELDKVTVQVRYVDMNKFLKINVWWIIVLTIAFVAFVIFLSIVTKRGKTTVERIERVYQVYCQCISNDSLSISELKRIKREITHCLHKVEDLNIDALNQYEKATRYLRKSLNDTKKLLKQYDKLSLEEKHVMYDGLDKDLAKALKVAKEIENAKGLIEQYHASANRKNYEEPEKPAKTKEKKKKD